MSIEVIGAGFGRTGTLSLKHALEQLGYNKCHHMLEIFADPAGQLPHWNKLVDTGSADYDAMFSGYKAVVDFPGSIYYKQLMAKYPEAKVILTVRDAEKWYKSAHDTIYSAVPGGFDKFMMSMVSIFKPQLRGTIKAIDFAEKCVWKGFFKNNFADKANTIKFYNEWIEDVKKSVPADKLIVFEVKDGWEPLCAFLNKPVPSTPFPKVNDTAEFIARAKGMKNK